MSRLITAAGVDFIKEREELRTSAYKDGAGVWTLGYGCTRNIHEGMTCTPDEAEHLLECTLLSPEHAVDCALLETATDEQFDAMVSLAYNIGNYSFLRSSVLRYHNAKNYDAASKAFLLWCNIHVDGVLTFSQGLLNRRQLESQLYLGHRP